MKNLKYIVALILIAALSLPLCMNAQEKKDVPIGVGLQLKNMHLWRGLQVADEFTAAADVYLTDKNQKFKVGLWGGAGLSGNFKEFDYYASFNHNGFSIAVWDIYNFSKGADYNNTEVFNYNARETGHFVDVTIGYTFQGNFPLSLSWSTIVFGRDRALFLGNMHEKYNKKNLYSTYVAASYKVLRDKFIDLELGIAGAFALDPIKGTSQNFYGKSAGIVNVNFVASKAIKITDSYSIPISVMGMWNPANSNANIQVALDLLTF